MKTFTEFWPFYCRAHAKPATRWIHFAGSVTGPPAAAAAVLQGHPAGLLLWPLIGYGAAWTAHFLVEGNRPATFGHPLWSLAADYRMVALMLAGRMDAEVARARAADL